MSFDATITLKNAAAANVSMLRLAADLVKSKYIDGSSTPATPRTMEITHTVATSPNGVDRHLLKFQKTALDSNSRPQTLTMTKTLTVPRQGIVRADVDDLIAMEKEFWTSGNIDKMLRNEI
jgi:hypothetical protein